MHHVQSFAHTQSDQELHSKALDQIQSEASKLVSLEEVIEVDAEELEGNADVPAEHEAVFHLHDVAAIAWVFAAQAVKDFYFDCPLLLKPLLVPEDLEGHSLVALIIKSLDYLAERAFPQETHDFVSVGYVISLDDFIKPLLIVEAVVRLSEVRGGFLGSEADEVDALKLKEFQLFVTAEDIHDFFKAAAAVKGSEASTSSTILPYD
eukprot:CAMPEP_0204909082 /NCGR_PEP_ID=MMETSP1397-20131031/7877_1 /ASSEMBLY_ACC=CAM_ASM_000891 /TAXON_ID=49980 /ORGANISM="Climacostomum Climacostomum virens, Strain Stock W-24" /LENGTH=206 /DNA_ID=CAMNT_0052078807 /DNA_START=850 /DNA_END=1471 /DNA_ORIENTATION=-